MYARRIEAQASTGMGMKENNNDNKNNNNINNNKWDGTCPPQMTALHTPSKSQPFYFIMINLLLIKDILYLK